MTRDALDYFESEEYEAIEQLIISTGSQLQENVELNLIRFNTKGLKTNGAGTATTATSESCSWKQSKDYFAEFCPGNKTSGAYSLRIVDKNQDSATLQDGARPASV